MTDRPLRALTKHWANEVGATYWVTICGRWITNESQIATSQEEVTCVRCARRLQGRMEQDGKR